MWQFKNIHILVWKPSGIRNISVIFIGINIRESDVFSALTQWLYNIDICFALAFYEVLMLWMFLEAVEDES